MTDRTVKTTLIIDESGAVKAVHAVGDESGKTTPKLEHLDKGVKQLGHSFGGLKTMIGAGLGALGVGGIAYGLKDIVSGLGETTAEVEKFHAVSGIGAQKSLDLTAALKARGIGSEAGANAFKFLSKNIQSAERQQHSFGVSQVKAAESGKAVTGLLGVQALAFKELGINVKDFAKLGEEQKLDLVTKKFENMADGAQKTRLAVQLFGRGGTALLPVLDKGALGLGHFTDLARKYFPTLKEGSAGLEEWKLKQDEFDLASEGLEFTLGMKLIPVLSDVASELSKTILEIEKGHGTWGTLERDIEGVVSVGKSILGFFERSKLATKALTYALYGLGAAWGIDKVLAFGRAMAGLSVITGISKAIQFLAGGDVLLTLQVGLLDAAGGMTAFGAATVGALAAIAPFVAAGAAVYGIIEGLDHILPAGSRPENLLGGNQPGEKKREGQIGFKQRLNNIAHEQHLHHHSQATTAHGGTAKIELHVSGHVLGEVLVRDAATARLLAESSAHYTSKLAARK